MIRIPALLALTLCLATLVEVSCLHLPDALKNAGKQMVDKAAEAADKTPEVEQTGGVRSTILHTGVNLAMDQGLDLLAKKYPVVALAAPAAKKLAKPLLQKAHSKINTLFGRDDSKDENAADGQKVEADQTSDDSKKKEPEKEEVKEDPKKEEKEDSEEGEEKPDEEKEEREISQKIAPKE